MSTQRCGVVQCAVVEQGRTLFLGGLLIMAVATDANSQSKNTAVPVGYQKLVAQHMGANPGSYPIIAAQISRPGTGWAGLFDGGNRPVVCTNITIRGPFIDQTHTTAYFFSGGQIERAAGVGAGATGGAVGGMLTCGNLTYVNFPQIVTKARSKGAR